MKTIYRKLIYLFEKFRGSRPFQSAAYGFWSLALAINKNWAKALEGQGDALLQFNRFEEGFGKWRQAISLQSEDRYDAIYRRSVTLLHRGQADAMMDIQRMGIECQKEYARKHRLDALGIRFLRRWTYAIGHMCFLDTYVKMGQLGLRGSYRPIIIDAAPANRHYLEYWRPYIPDIVTDPKGVKLLTPLAQRLEEHLHMVDFADGRLVYHLAAAQEVQARWDSEGRKPLLKLTEADDKRGRECLEKLGVPPGAWFVGLHVRDDNSGNSRDSDINSYRLAIEAVTERGGWVIRTGNPAMPPLPPMVRVIDYAKSPYLADWMDVFIWARSRFFIGTRSGPAYIPPTFGVPVVVINSFPITMSFPFPCLEIYKLYRKKDRLLTFAEAVASQLGLSEDSRYVASLGITTVDNTPEEIKDVVVEMMDRLDGRQAYTREDEELQARFKNLTPRMKNRLGVYNGRLGSAFIKKYQALL